MCEKEIIIYHWWEFKKKRNIFDFIKVHTHYQIMSVSNARPPPALSICRFWKSIFPGVGWRGWDFLMYSIPPPAFSLVNHSTCRNLIYSKSSFFFHTRTFPKDNYTVYFEFDWFIPENLARYSQINSQLLLLLLPISEWIFHILVQRL